MNTRFHNKIGRDLTAMSLVWMMLMLPLAAIAQTRVSMPKNKYDIRQDVEIGQKTSREVEQQMPVLNDSQATNYIQQVGQRLVNAIPSEFQHPEFQYSFKIINASDINAFALPGGPMYVNRGMIEQARNEGEMAGVMAHEIAHVALRHGTAGATKQGSVGSQLGVIGLILGGAILGGQTGAQLGMLGAQAWMTKYSREYETQSDILGSQIMANAGYDPVDLANMFQTIARQSGGQRAPQWLSSHPDPGNRYNNIIRESRMLRISPEPYKITRGFRDTQARLRNYGPAPTMAEIERNAKQGGSAGQNPTAGGTYRSRVPAPSSRYTTFNQSGLYVEYPNNWRSFPSQNSVMFAPEGGYGNEGISHGAMVAIGQGSSGRFEQDASNLIQQIAQSNGYRITSNLQQATINGRDGYAAEMRGQSNITGQTEVARIFTSPLRNGNILYVVVVAPQSEFSRYTNAFSRILGSVQYNG